MVAPIVAVSVSVSDPFLLRRYASYVKSGTEGGRRQNKKVQTRLQQKLEEQLAKLNVSVNTGFGKKEIRQPDFQLKSSDFQDALGKIFEDKITEIESKLKVTSILERKPSGKLREGTKIGKRVRTSAKFTDSILAQSKFTAQELQTRNNTTNLDSVDLFDDEEVRKDLNKNFGVKMLEVVKSDPKLKATFLKKATTLQLTSLVGDKLILTTMKFNESHFRVPPFKFSIKKGGDVFISLNDQFERVLQQSILDAQAGIVPSQLKQYEKDIIAISKGKFVKNETIFQDTPFQILTRVPTGGSIPMAVGRLKRDRKLIQRGQQRGRRRREGIGVKQVTAAQFSAILRARMNKLGPHGPVGGRPSPASTRLTHRTGEYLASIQVANINYKNKLIDYFYGPKYVVHETLKGGQRNPQDTLNPTIRAVAFQLLGQNFTPNNIN